MSSLRRLLERDVHDRVAVKCRHAAEAPLVDEVGGLEAESRREDAVARCRDPAALDVSEHGDARLEPGSLLDLASQRITDPAEHDVAELVGLPRLAGDELSLARLVRQLVALADDDDREVLPAVVPLARAPRRRPRR